MKEAQNTILAVTAIAGAGTVVLNWLKDRPDLGVMAVNRTRLQSRDAAERLKALDTLTAMVDEKPKFIDVIFGEVVNVIAQQTRRPGLKPCGAKRDSSYAVRYGPDVEAAFSFLRRFPRTKVDSAIALQRVDISTANLNGADLRQFEFKDSCLDSVQMVRARIDRARFFRDSMRASRLDSAFGAYVAFNHTDLRAAVLDHDSLPGAIFVNADLSASFVRRATLDSAQFSDAKIAWADFRFTRFRGVADWAEVDTDHVAGALFTEAKELMTEDRSMLRRYGACVDSIKVQDWHDRLIGKARRDTTCGLPNAAWLSRRRR